MKLTIPETTLKHESPIFSSTEMLDGDFVNLLFRREDKVSSGYNFEMFLNLNETGERVRVLFIEDNNSLTAQVIDWKFCNQFIEYFHYIISYNPIGGMYTPKRKIIQKSIEVRMNNDTLLLEFGVNDISWEPIPIPEIFPLYDKWISKLILEF
jgi:hypothetical protein